MTSEMISEVTLLGFLNTNYPNGYNDGMVNDFRELGIKIRGPDAKTGAINLKYDQIKANWSNPLTHFCRGCHVLFNESMKEWEYIVRTPEKFFNYYENKIGQPYDRTVRGFDMVAPKMDGTCICISVHKTNDGSSVVIATLGATNAGGSPSNPEVDGQTFHDVVVSVFGSEDVIIDVFPPNVTFLFELCGDVSRVVTDYAAHFGQPTLCYLLARDNFTGEYIGRDDVILEDFFDDLHDLNHGLANTVIPVPMHRITDVIPEIKVDEIKKFANNDEEKLFFTKLTSDFHSLLGLNGKEKFIGVNPEGLVIYRFSDDYNGFAPIAKVKDDTYLSLHGMRGQSRHKSVWEFKIQILTCILREVIDDVQDGFDRPNMSKDEITSLVTEIQTMWNTFETKVIESVMSIGEKINDPESDLSIRNVRNHMSDIGFPSFLQSHVYCHIKNMTSNVSIREDVIKRLESNKNGKETFKVIESFITS